MKSLKGMHDIYYPEVHYYKKIENLVDSLFTNYGFSEIRTPILEDISIFKRSVGEDTDIVSKEMYHFKYKHDQEICLRPENTASIVRSYLQHNMSDASPLTKLYYVGPMFRRERPQKGRFRQFYQVGAEIFGSQDPSIDAELLKLLTTFFEKFSIKGLYTEINSIGCPKCRPAYRKNLSSFLKSLNNLCEDCNRRKESNPLRVFDCKNETCQKQVAGAPTTMENLCQECSEHFAGLKKHLASLKISYKENPRLVRGLDYYTKTVFEVKSDSLGAQNTLCGGGRYDELVKEFGGPQTPAIGFSLGVERFILSLKDQEKFKPEDLKPDIFIAAISEDAQKFIYPQIFYLKENAIKVEYDFSKNNLKKLLKLSDKLNAKFTLIVGDDELKKGQAILRDMQSKEQFELATSNIIENCIKQIKKI